MPHAPILFDLDGTLLNTLTDIAAAANHALSELDQPTHPTPDYRRMVGDGADVLMRRALPDDQQALAGRALELFKQHYIANMYAHTAPYPGIDDLLAALSERDIPRAVLTNKPHPAAVEMVARLFPEVTFTAVFGHRDSVPKKPDPAAALQIAQACGAAPTACHFVGDSNTDMHTAVNARMIPVAVTWGFRDRAELIDAGAKIVLQRPMDLLHHI